jgi:hypothetical protein
MGYGDALFKRMWVGRAGKKIGGNKEPAPKEDAPPAHPVKKGMPFLYAVLLMAGFYLLTADLWPSIAIPFVIWLVVKYKG